MMQSILTLGRQPALGLAELESLYGDTTVEPIGSHAAGVDLPASEVDFGRLGSSTRLGTILGEVPSTDWRAIEKALMRLARSTSFALPTSGKFHLGLSAIGFSISPAKLNATGLTLKKVLRTRHDGSVRLVPNVEAELNTAQVFHNHLADENGAELLIIARGNATVIARTTAVQDIDSYTLRDRGRPKRDARVGMLPPKLAQTIINLAVGPIQQAQDSSLVSPQSSVISHPTSVILDPFCGTGVVLQEALLMGYPVFGTDLEPRMVSYTKDNLAWLDTTYSRVQDLEYRLDAGDATAYTWTPAPQFVACETYLGKPFTDVPNREILEQTISEVNVIIKKFLKNIRPQLAAGTRLCLAVPAWFTAPQTGSNGGNPLVHHLPLLEKIDEFGFTRISFKHASPSDLIYRREDQVVGRELLVLELSS